MRDWALPRSVAPAGGIVSCVADQLRWARFHLGDGRAPDGTRVLRASTLRAMQRKQRDAGAMADAVGIAWLLRRVGDAWTVGHGGTTYGQLSAFTMVPERDFAVTVLTNSTRGGRVHAEVVRWALDRILGMRAPEPTWRTLPRARLAAYEGRYPIGAGYWAADLRARDGGLRVRFVRIKEHAHPDGSSAPVDADWPPAPMMLRFVAPDRAQVPEGPQQRLRVDFLRDPRDRVVWMRWGGRLLRRRPLP